MFEIHYRTSLVCTDPVYGATSWKLTRPTAVFLQLLVSEWRHHVGAERTVQQSQLLEGEHSHTRQPQYSGSVLPQQVAVRE